MDWITYTIICVVALSVSILLQRTLLSKDKTDPYAYSVVFPLLVAGLLFAAALVTGLDFDGFSSVWLVAVLCMVLYGIGSIFYAKTLQLVDASSFSVLFATHAIWVMVAGIIIYNETLSWFQIVGSVLIFASVLVLARFGKNLRPDKGTAYGLLTGVFYGLAITCLSYAGRSLDALTWSAVSFVGPALVVLLIRPSSVRKMKPLLKGNVLKRLLLLGVFYAIGSYAMLLAYQLGPLSIVSPLRQTGIIATALLAFVFIKSERTSVARKLLASLIATIGVVLLVI